MSKAKQKTPLADLPAEELFEIAKEAAVAKKPGEMIKVLAASYFLDGLQRRLVKKWGRLPPHEIEGCVGCAVDHAYTYLTEKNFIGDLGGWLYKAADNLAHDLWKKDYSHRHLDSEDVLDKEAHDEGQLSVSERLRQDDIADSRKTEAIRLARELLPKIGQGQIVKVMELVIDAVEQDIPDLPPKDIADTLGITPSAARSLLSRGFKRLTRLAREEGIEIPEYCMINEDEN